ncbi:MAG: ATP-dependent DNA helicase [Anaerovoracaceae bacterium]
MNKDKSMLEQYIEEIDYIFDEDGPIKKNMDAYKPRPSQIEGAKKVCEALCENKHLILEGPCGFGKSFTYLIPIVLSSCEKYKLPNKGKTVIVTAGISLQEQLYKKDIVKALNVIRMDDPDVSLKYSMLKGKQNFICLNKVVDMLADRFLAKQQFPSNKSEIEKILDWIENTSTGDLSDLDFVPPSFIQQEICCTTPEQCVGKVCPCYDDCFHNRHKAKSRNADIIVTNYHLFFTDLKTGGNVLPAFDTVVFDEAHETADIFRDFMEVKFSEKTMSYINGRFTMIKNLVPEVVSKSIEKEVADAINNVSVKEFFARADKKFFYKQRFKTIQLVTKSAMPKTEDVIDCIYNLKSAISELENNIEIKANILNGEGVNEEEVANTYRALATAGELMGLLSGAMFMLTMSHEDNDDHMFYFEKTETSMYLKSKPIEVAQTLADNYLSKENMTVIFTSATISVKDSFEYIRNQVGLNVIENKNERVLEFLGQSPFNLTEQQLWYMPQNCIDGNLKEFEENLPMYIKEIIRATHGGALLLFTSNKNMKNVHEEVMWTKRAGNTFLDDINLLVQNSMPRTKLIDTFKDDHSSVLFATRSFFTGVDVPGQSLRCVVIDKLPFPQPTDPLQQVLSLRPNSFAKYTIPQMIITLKQAIGRSVRSVDDKCVVVILDGRMTTARYKGQIAGSFNYKKTATRNIDDIPKFLGYDDVKSDFVEPDDFEEFPF